MDEAGGVSIWFKHDAHFHEHPKCLRLRRLAGPKGDAAEIGWWRIVAAAKRHGSWSFEDEEHLQGAAGRYYGFVRLYREVGLLDDLTIHNGTEYQGPRSDAERQALSRSGRDTRHDGPVTDVTTRVEQSRAKKNRAEAADDRPDIEAFLLVTRRAPTERQRKLLDGLLDRHDRTGAAWAADIILRHPDDPIGAVIKADQEYRAERIAEAQAAERPKPQPRRPRGLPTATRELIEEWRKQNEPGDAA